MKKKGPGIKIPQIPRELSVGGARSMSNNGRDGCYSHIYPSRYSPSRGWYSSNFVSLLIGGVSTR